MNELTPMAFLVTSAIKVLVAFTLLLAIVAYTTVSTSSARC
jgi:hypothetical protein